jgi:steroid delta-isomerase-like uncharacterized protein
MYSMYRNALMMSALTLVAVACEDEPKPPPPTPPAKTATQEPKKPEAKVEKLSGEQMAARTKACFAAHDSGDEKTIRDCYTPDAKQTMVDSLPPMQTTSAEQTVTQFMAFAKAFTPMKHELGVVLVNGENVVVVGTMHATNSGEFMGKPATNKELGLLFGEHIRIAGDKAAALDIWMDQSSMMAQLGMVPADAASHARPAEKAGQWGETQVVVAKNDKKETDNLALYDQSNAAFNKHDTKAAMAFYADDVKFRDASDPKDVDGKADMEKGLAMFYKMSSDVKSEPKWKWAAGDYVVASVHMTGTFDGDVEKMKATNKPYDLTDLEVVKLDNGKIKEHWIFDNGYKFAVDVGLAPAPDTTMAAKEGDKPADDTKPATAPGKHTDADTKPTTAKPTTAKQPSESAVK